MWFVNIVDSLFNALVEVFFFLKKRIYFTRKYLVLDHPAIGSDKGVNLACSEGCCVLTRENFHAPTYKHTTYTATKILFA